MISICKQIPQIKQTDHRFPQGSQIPVEWPLLIRKGLQCKVSLSPGSKKRMEGDKFLRRQSPLHTCYMQSAQRRSSNISADGAQGPGRSREVRNPYSLQCCKDHAHFCFFRFGLGAQDIFHHEQAMPIRFQLSKYRSYREALHRVLVSLNAPYWTVITTEARASYVQALS